MISTIQTTLEVKNVGAQLGGMWFAQGPLRQPPEPEPPEVRWGDEPPEFYWWKLGREAVRLSLTRENDGSPKLRQLNFGDPGEAPDRSMLFPFSHDLIAYQGEAKPAWLNSEELYLDFLQSCGRHDTRIPYLLEKYGPLGSEQCVALNPGRGYPSISISAADPYDRWAGNILFIARVVGAAELRSKIKLGKGEEVLGQLRTKDFHDGSLIDIDFPFTNWRSDNETFIHYTDLLLGQGPVSLDDYNVSFVDEKLKEYIEFWLQEKLSNQYSLAINDFKPVYQPSSLQGILWEIVRRKVADDKCIFGVCPKCKKPWSRTGRQAHPDSLYCSKRCRSAAKQQAYRNRQKAGESNG